MTFTPTAEQTAIVEAAQSTADNLCVVARAGAAKTSTLILIAEALPKTEILCLAFNKKIAEEMASRLPHNCESKTLHGLGYKVWWQFTRKKVQVKSNKSYTLLKQRIETLDKDDQTDAYSSMAETLDIISWAKNEGYLPVGGKLPAKPLIGEDDFFDNLPMEPTALQIALVNAVLTDSFQRAFEGIIDFDDMIYCPALCSVSWPIYPLTLIDEAQDLSPINHHILKKLVRNKRIIAVGDPYQAIYGFRGAYSDSMSRLADQFQMRELRLTISFRCARAITENARWLAADMKAPEWAKEGEVLRPMTWSSAEIPDGAAIICRNNAPLFSTALRLLEAGRLPEIAGRDLAKPLLKILNALGKPQMPKIAALDALDTWRGKELERARPGAKGQVEDKAACLEIIISRTKTLGDAAVYLQHLLDRDGRIYLMTGHKSKGLEFDTVYFLDPQLCKINRDQDANIKYVIETRAKTKLIYVSSDTFTTGATE